MPEMTLSRTSVRCLMHWCNHLAPRVVHAHCWHLSDYLGRLLVLCGGGLTIHCDVQMSSAQGEELLALARQLREAGGHRALDTVLQDMEDELSRSLAKTRKGSPNQ